MRNKEVQWGNIPMKGELDSCTIIEIARSEGGKANKGSKLSNEHKKLLSKLKIGTTMPKESVAKSIAGSKETKWNQLLQKYPLNLIKKVQKKHSNHQTNTCKELGISFLSYKKLCKHYNIEKKKSSIEKSEYAITKQSNAILVWKEKNGNKIGKPTEYYSVSECVRALSLHKPNMLRNLKNETAYRNMFFEYKK
jgi:arginyl-tRNA synthetase